MFGATGDLTEVGEKVHSLKFSFANINSYDIAGYLSFWSEMC
jgi:hypothetical protein